MGDPSLRFPLRSASKSSLSSRRTAVATATAPVSSSFWSSAVLLSPLLFADVAIFKASPAPSLSLLHNKAVRAGCTVLRLPPYQCEFIPIELALAKVKNGVDAPNGDFELSTVHAILRDKIKQVMAEDWKKSIQYMMEVEAKVRLNTTGTRKNPIFDIAGERREVEDARLADVAIEWALRTLFTEFISAQEQSLLGKVELTDTDNATTAGVDRAVTVCLMWINKIASSGSQIAI
ncbi:hypothetical protein MRX96_055419 [Rhipicephalus microplus]